MTDYTASKLYLLNITKKKILIVRSRKHWSLPGGKREDGENDPRETLLRELGEELPNLSYNIQLEDRYNRLGWSNIVYIATSHYYDGSKIDIGSEILDYKWIRRSHLSYYSIYWMWYYPSIKSII